MDIEHYELTSKILNSCFEVMNELGTGFLESVYKNAILITLDQKKILVEIEKTFEIYFREQRVGLYRADMIIDRSVILELKCCKSLLPEHQAQLINYLKAAHIPIGLLINFGNQKLEYKRLYNPFFSKNDCSLKFQ